MSGFDVGEMLTWSRPWYVRLWRWLVRRNDSQKAGTLTITAVDKDAGVITSE